jgi:metabotropic glutamate receptor 5
MIASVLPIQVEEEAVGGISIRIQSPYIEWFDNHYFPLNPWTNNANPWFKEFWSVKFECQLPDAADTLAAFGANSEYYFNRTCTGEQF